MSSVSILGAFGASQAVGEDRVNPAGTTINNTVVLNAGDSLANGGVIDVANGVGAGYPGPDTGTITFILNDGSISSGNDLAVGINGNLGTFTNTGSLSGVGGAFGVAGDIGAFTNSGLIASTGNSAVGVGGSIGSFTNTGTLSGQRFEAVYVQGGVGSFVNGQAGVIVNTDGLGQDGNGVSFNTDLIDGGAVGSFVNNGLIQGDLASANSNGVAFFDQSNNVPNAFVTNSFTNSGTISGANAGVQSRGGFNDFSNTGLISGGQNGLNVDGDIGMLTNSGTITGGTQNGINARRHITSLANSGTIEGNGGSAIFVNGGVDSFVNEATGLIRNAGANPGFGNGVDFNTDLQQGGAVLSFVNNGTIIADLMSQAGAGVGFFDDSNAPNAFQTGTFTNSGSITGAGNGVFSRGGFGSFTNSGTIAGGIYEGVFTDGDIGTFTNIGTIGSPNGGVGIQGMTGSFSNGGAITGGDGRGVSFNGFVGAFDNSGTVTSVQNGVSFGAGFNTATNSGTILSTAPNGEIGVRIDEPGGVFTNTGTIQGAAGVVYILNTPGSNTLANAGTIRGTDGTAIAFDGGADSDDLLRLETGSKIFGNVAFGAGIDTLDFADFNGNTLLRIYDLENLIAGDKTYFQLPNDQLGIIEKTGIVGATNQVTNDAVLSITQLLRRPGFTDGTSNGAQAPVMGYAATPAPTPASTAIADAQQGNGMSVWGSLIGGGSHDGAPVDLSNTFGGIVAGSHAQVMSGVKLGILGAVVGTRVDTNAGGQTIDSTNGVVGIYGTTDVSIAEVNFALLGGFAQNRSQRNLVALGAAETAVADYSSWFISPSLGITVPVVVTDSGELRVTGNATYVGGQVSDYQETGSSMNLTVGSASLGMLDARIGLEGLLYGNPTAFGTVQFSANAGVYVQSNLGGSSAPVSLLGQTLDVVLPGTSDIGVYGGAALNVAISTGVDIHLGVEGRLRNDGLIGGSAQGGIIAKF